MFGNFIQYRSNQWKQRQNFFLWASIFFLCFLSLFVTSLKSLDSLVYSQTNPEPSITGRVTDVNDIPIANITVWFYQQVGPYFHTSGSTSTDQNGEYEFVDVLPGAYRVNFEDNNFPQKYQPEAYNNAYDGAPITLVIVTGTLVIENINAQMEGFGSVAGTVRDVDGQPISNMEVLLFTLNGEEPTDTVWEPVGFADTDATGEYIIEDLLKDTYRLGFAHAIYPPLYHPGYYGDVLHITETQDIQVGRGEEVIGKDYLSMPFSEVTGKVTDQNGEPIADIAVNLISDKLEHPGVINWALPESSLTNGRGEYRIKTVYAGRYTIQFQDGAQKVRYSDQYHSDVSEVEDATYFIINHGDVGSTIDATLSKLGSLGGYVTDIDGTPLSNVSVTACELSAGCLIENGLTDTTGIFLIEGVAPGTYALSFYSQEYGLKYFNGTLVADGLLVTLPISLSQNITDVHAMLEPFTKISGRVTDKDDKPIAGMTVKLYNSNQCCKQHINSAQTEADGTYNLFGVLSGQYKLHFSDENIPQNFLNVYYGNTIDSDDSNEVMVTVGEELIGINAQLESLGGISGQIVDMDGIPITLSRVRSFHQNPDPCCENWIDVGTFYSADTDSEGRYRLTLEPGIYRVRAEDLSSPLRYISTYYPDALNVDIANNIEIQKTEIVTGIDITLADRPFVFFPLLSQ
ncbi:MAG: carboxypeptidase-like regulatory domain-containing protein [Chloroflexota bacterium]